MAPLFSAFDRPKYAKLILEHLEEMLSIPATILSRLQQGGLTVSLLGRACHSIAVDEAHEMGINKECKEFTIRPSAEYINRTAQFLSIRASAITNLEAQVFADSKDTSQSQLKSLQAVDPESKKHETNVQSQINNPLQFYSQYSLKPPNYNTYSTTKLSLLSSVMTS